MPPRQFFKGTTFALSGTLSQTHDSITEVIRKFGGEVSNAVTGAVDCLITTEEDVKANKVKVAKATALDVPILKENYLFECQVAKNQLPVGKFRIKVAVPKKRAAPARDGAAAAAAPAPAKVRKVPKVVKDVVDVETTADVPVIAKSGLGDDYAVVKQSVTKGYAKGNIVWDVELVLNDPAMGKDKFYCIQLVSPKPGSDNAGFYVIYHWGKTGNAGTCMSDGPFDTFQGARPSFQRRFRQKTGNIWGQLGATFVDVAGKYRVVVKDDKKIAAGRWQYYLHNEVDGKKIGWYDYDGAAAKNMEKFWRQYNSNEGLAVRIVRSDYFKYEVNFGDMIQKNTKSGMRRVVRRLEPGARPSKEPPAKIPEKHKPEKKKEAEDSSADEEEFEDPGDEEEELEEEEEDAEMPDAEAAPAAAAEGGGRAAPEADEPAAAAAGGREAPPEAKEADDAPEAAAGGREAPAAAAAGGRAPPPGDDEAETLKMPGELETVPAEDLPVRGGR